MPDPCLVCLRPLPASGRGDYHPRCLRAVTGSSRVPRIEVDSANLYLFGLEMAGRVSLSGVQRKLSLGPERKSLRVVADRSSFILKPQAREFPNLPENEHLSLRLATLIGLPVAAVGLVRLASGEPALLVRRFDRRDDGRRLAMEDFCQLNELPPAEKYDGSAELCARTVKYWSDQPGVDLATLFRAFVFSWWIGNGDLHLKNLALLEREAGRPRLAPAFELVNTSILIPGDSLALPVCGRRANVGAREWRAFAAYCGLPARLVQDEGRRLAAAAPAARELTRSSLLPPILRDAYLATLEARLPVLEELAR